MGVRRLSSSPPLRLFQCGNDPAPDLGVRTWNVGIIEVKMMLYSPLAWESFPTTPEGAQSFEGGIWGILKIA